MDCADLYLAEYGIEMEKGYLSEEVDYYGNKYYNSKTKTENIYDEYEKVVENFGESAFIMIGISGSWTLTDIETGETYVVNGAHNMTVVGTTEDGDLIVSSWGKEYIIDGNSPFYQDDADNSANLYIYNFQD